MIKKQLIRLDKAASPGPSSGHGGTAVAGAEALEEMVQFAPVPEEVIDVVARRLPGRQACANIVESRAQALKELPDETHAQVGELLDGSRSGLLSVLVRRSTHASGTRVR